MVSNKYPSPKSSALITSVRGSIVNAKRCELRVTGFAFCFFLTLNTVNLSYNIPLSFFSKI